MNNKRKDPKTSKEAASSLIIKVTNKCVLSCDYCFVNLRETQFMTTEAAKKAIDRYWEMFELEKQTRSPVINYYGGEPMLGKELIMESTKYIRKLDAQRIGNETTIILNTNAILVDREFAEFAKNNHILVIVSLDGSREIHNIHRKNLKGKGSFDDVVKGIKILKNLGVEVTISITLTPENSKKTKSLIKIIKELGIKNICARPLLGKSMESHGIIKYAREAASSTVSYANEAKKFGIKELQICEGSEFSRVSGIDLGCPMSANQIVANPNGTFSLCKSMPEFTKIGDMDTPSNELWFAKLKMVEKLKQRLPAFNKECKDCRYKKKCTGGCAFSAMDITSDLMKKDPLCCEYSKKLYELLEG